MKKLKGIVLVVVGVLCLAVGASGQEASVVVHPDGLKFANGETFMVIESVGTAADIISNIEANVKIKINSKNISVEVLNDVVLIKDFIPGYTKTDKSSGSAYQLDIFYKVTVEVKDGRYKINVPELDIAANQKYDGFAVMANPGVEFTMTMGFSGKRDIWNNREKKLFIFDEKGKLVEKSTKDKLEKDLSGLMKLIVGEKTMSDW